MPVLLLICDHLLSLSRLEHKQSSLITASDLGIESMDETDTLVKVRPWLFAKSENLRFLPVGQVWLGGSRLK